MKNIYILSKNTVGIVFWLYLPILVKSLKNTNEESRQKYVNYTVLMLLEYSLSSRQVLLAMQLQQIQ